MHNIKEIQDIVQALNRIDQHYTNVIGINESHIEYQQSAENAFNAEFYYQLKSKIINDSHYQGIQVHMDLNKPKADNIRPDIVLHAGPNSINDQRVYIEVKTNKLTQKTDIVLDLIKLNLSVEIGNGFTTKLGYKLGIYIVANYSLKKMKELIIAQFNDSSKAILNRLCLIYLERPKYKPEIIPFNQIINNV